MLDETLLTASGDRTRVVSVLPRPGPEPVYNLEIDVEHVYYVSAAGILAHNAKLPWCGPELSGPKNAKALVLGEGMHAVRSVARGLLANGVNAKWYQVWQKNFPKNRPMTRSELDAALARNARWIRGKAKEGYRFYDIGPDPSRKIRSPFYALEKDILKKLGVRMIPLGR